jgi:hypothetical protein
MIHSQRRLVVTTGEGHVTFTEVRRHQDLLLADPAFDPQFNQLIDATTMTWFDVSAEEARQIAEQRMFSPVSRRAFLASKPSIFGIGRLMQVYQERHTPVHVFSDRQSALTWLGIDEEFVNY